MSIFSSSIFFFPLLKGSYTLVACALYFFFNYVGVWTGFFFFFSSSSSLPFFSFFARALRCFFFFSFFFFFGSCLFFFTAGDNQVRDRRPINATHKRVVPFEIMQQLPLICFGLQTRYTIDQNRIVVWGQSDLTIVCVKRKARYALVQAVFSSIFSCYCFLSSFVTLLYFLIYIDNVLCITLYY